MGDAIELTQDLVRSEHQPAWRVASDRVEAFLTRLGGHLGPVTFDRHGRAIRPYSVAPWAGESHDDQPAMLRALRGDFFCLPFGGNETPYHGEQHPPHGETANNAWTLESIRRRGNGCELHASLNTTIRPGRVEKHIRLVDGQDAVYDRHVVSGMAGPMTVGHHAMLKFPDKPGSGVVSTSGFFHGQVFPGQFEDPAQGGRQSLKPGAEFDRLDRVPTLDGATADLTRYPARPGCEDLVMLTSDPAAPLAWSAVTFPEQGYAWFALKDPATLAHTVLWISNGGRDYAPWNGRHRNVMGIEEVTACFHHGLAESAAPNAIADRGYPTVLELTPDKPLCVNYIHGIAAIPADFDRVARIEPEEATGGVTLIADSGVRVQAPLDVGFLRQGPSA